LRVQFERWRNLFRQRCRSRSELALAAPALEGAFELPRHGSVENGIRLWQLLHLTTITNYCHLKIFIMCFLQQTNLRR
jgi:hypothetical protein